MHLLYKLQVISLDVLQRGVVPKVILDIIEDRRL